MVLAPCLGSSLIGERAGMGEKSPSSERTCTALGENHGMGTGAVFFVAQQDGEPAGACWRISAPCPTINQWGARREAFCGRSDLAQIRHVSAALHLNGSDHTESEGIVFLLRDL